MAHGPTLVKSLSKNCQCRKLFAGLSLRYRYSVKHAVPITEIRAVAKLPVTGDDDCEGSVRTLNDTE